MMSPVNLRVISDSRSRLYNANRVVWFRRAFLGYPHTVTSFRVHIWKYRPPHIPCTTAFI